MHILARDKYTAPAAPKPTKVTQKHRTFKPVDKARLAALTDRNNPACCFYGLIGQEAVIDKLLALLLEGLENENHCISSALMFTGQASAGKTFLAKRLASGLHIPFVETDPNQIAGTESIFELCRAAAEEAGLPLVRTGEKNGKDCYTFPTMTVFIDEIQGLRADVMRSMLKAFESADRTLVTPDAYVDVRNVLWIGATTHYGEILKKNEPFASRFQKVDFASFTVDQVAQIVKLNNPDWTLDECKALAIRSGCIAREAKELAEQVDRQMRLMQLHDKDVSRLEAVDIIGKQNQIDEYGVTQKQLSLLKALANRFPKGMTYGQMANIVNTGEEELRRRVLPALQIENADRDARIMTTHRTFIREAGMDELLKRDLVTEKDMEAFREAA